MNTDHTFRPLWITKIPTPSGSIKMAGYPAATGKVPHLVFMHSEGWDRSFPARLWLLPGRSCWCVGRWLDPEMPEILSGEFQRFMETRNGVVIALHQRPEEFGRVVFGNAPRWPWVAARRCIENESGGPLNCTVARILANLGIHGVCLEYPPIENDHQVTFGQHISRFLFSRRCSSLPSGETATT